MQDNIGPPGTKRKRQCFSRRSDKGACHQRPAAPRSERSDKGLSHQTSLLPRSVWPDLPLPVGELEGLGACQCQISDSPLTRPARSDKGGSHQAPEGPRSDRGGSHQAPEGPRSDRGGSHQAPEGPRSDKGGSHQAPEGPRSDKGGIHDKSSTSPPKDTLTAAQIYGEKYQSELRFLTCACCAFEGPRSGYRLLSDLKARGCLSWHRHTKRMIVEGLASSDSKYDRKYATILRDGLDEFGMIPKCKVTDLLLANYDMNVSTCQCLNHLISFL